MPSRETFLFAADGWWLGKDFLLLKIVKADVSKDIGLLLLGGESQVLSTPTSPHFNFSKATQAHDYR